MSCHVRLYEHTDREACRTLWRELTQTHRDLYDDQSIGGEHDPGDFFDEHLETAGADSVWVAELDGRVVGFTSLLRPKEALGELEPIVVAPEVRGSGVGKALALKVIERARELQIRRLDVRPAARNGAAIRFFHDLGFDSLGQLELMIYLQESKDWPVRETIADSPFRA